jgi:hypothetical protein
MDMEEEMARLENSSPGNIMEMMAEVSPEGSQHNLNDLMRSMDENQLMAIQELM